MGEASMGGAPSSSAAAQHLVVNRTLSELSRVAASGGAGNPSSGSQDVSQGVMLLASRNFDVAGLGADVMDLASDMATQGAAAQAFTPLGETHLHEYLAHHHQMIVSTVVADTQRATLNHAGEAIKRRQREDWDNDKMRLLHDLAGRRTGKWMPAQAPNHPHYKQGQQGQQQGYPQGYPLQLAMEPAGGAGGNPNVSSPERQRKARAQPTLAAHAHPGPRAPRLARALRCFALPPPNSGPPKPLPPLRSLPGTPSACSRCWSRAPPRCRTRTPTPPPGRSSTTSTWT